MVGFVIGALAGGAAIWVLRERLGEMVRERTPEMRLRAADRLERLEHQTEGVFDRARDRVAGGLRASQEYLRARGPKEGAGLHESLG